VSKIRSVLSSRKFNLALPWIAGLVLAIGVAVFIQSRTNTGDEPEVFEQGQVKDVSKNPKTVPVPEAARKVAVTFLRTAVVREDLATAWRVSGPSIRQGLTLKQWMTGNIAVVPYPAAAVDKAPIKIDWSYPKDVAIEVVLLPKKGSNDKPQVFHMGLKKLGSGPGRWVVEYWSPYAPPAVPDVID
jgi:hypothetical protein